MDNFGAFILGRNMFGPVRSAWPDKSWKGWWGLPAAPHDSIRRPLSSKSDIPIQPSSPTLRRYS
jgi:hypothetical protein